MLPSKLKRIEQKYEFRPDLAVSTTAEKNGLTLKTTADLIVEGPTPLARLRVAARADRPARLAAVLRPYNPEGVQFIEKIAYDPSAGLFRVDERTEVRFDPPPSGLAFSDYDRGDVLYRLSESASKGEVSCRVGLATAAALFPLDSERETRVEIKIPLAAELKREFPRAAPATVSWPTAMGPLARLEIPDERISYLYDCAAHVLVLLSAHDIFPGPFGYRRFWFRDACLMLAALTALGFEDRAERHIRGFIRRQQRDGYFRSQEGEWDSNGQVLWIMDRFQRLTGRDPDRSWVDAAVKGADWILNKRLHNQDSDLLEGLLPAGFSAEHLGPNNYYYWDDFWGAAGLRAAGRLAGLAGRPGDAKRLEEAAEEFTRAIFRSIEAIPQERSHGAAPAAPFRRLDAGAIGSMAADWPLRLTGPGDERIRRTADFLMNNCLHRGGFFQDMIHSGINIYLTLALAQTLLRFGDDRYQGLVEASAELASPTGQWPEAVHPFSGGGCMGDGQHGWAAAEWILMMRSLFVREEDDRLIIGSGLFPRWLEQEKPLFFGPAPTPFGPVSVSVTPQAGDVEVRVEASWREGPPDLEFKLRGCDPQTVREAQSPVIVKLKRKAP